MLLSLIHFFKYIKWQHSKSISNVVYFIILLLTLILTILALSISHTTYATFFKFSYSSSKFVHFILGSSFHDFRKIYLNSWVPMIIGLHREYGGEDYTKTG